MKKIYLISTLFISGSVFSQIGINTSAPQATLDITGIPSDSSKLDGVIAPRITGDQLRDKTYTSSQTGAIVYVITQDSSPSGQTVNVTSTGYYYFDGSVWIELRSKMDLRKINDSHITQDAGIGSDGTAIAGSNSIAIGENTLTNPNMVGNGNIAIGNEALKNSVGGGNIAIGLYSGDNISDMNGGSNTIIGFTAMRALSTGTGNIAIGAGAGGNTVTAPSALLSGQNNIFIGSGVKCNVSGTSSDQLNIGNWIYGYNGAIGIGSSAANPTQRLDVADGNVRIRDINTNVSNSSTDHNVVADANGVLKIISPVIYYFNGDMGGGTGQIINAAVNATTSWLNLQFPNSTYSTSSGVSPDAINEVFTFTQSGVYEIAAQAQFDGSAATWNFTGDFYEWMAMRIEVSFSGGAFQESNISRTVFEREVVTTSFTPVTTIINANTGDKIRVSIIRGGGANRNGGGDALAKYKTLIIKKIAP